MMEFECNGASLCQSSSSNPWVKVLLSRAAERGLIFFVQLALVNSTINRLTRSQPKMGDFPGDSISRIAFAAFSDHGRWAPRRAQASPSRIKYFARVLTDSGICESDAESTQVQSFPVGPDGSIGCVEAAEVMVIFEWRISEGKNKTVDKMSKMKIESRGSPSNL